MITNHTATGNTDSYRFQTNQPNISEIQNILIIANKKPVILFQITCKLRLLKGMTIYCVKAKLVRD